MNFFGRTQKLKELTAFYDREEENLAVIYGRRRVGKSELVCQSLKGRTEAVIYFAGSSWIFRKTAKNLTKQSTAAYAGRPLPKNEGEGGDRRKQLALRLNCFRLSKFSPSYYGVKRLSRHILRSRLDGAYSVFHVRLTPLTPFLPQRSEK